MLDIQEDRLRRVVRAFFHSNGSARDDVDEILDHFWVFSAACQGYDVEDDDESDASEDDENDLQDQLQALNEDEDQNQQENQQQENQQQENQNLQENQNQNQEVIILDDSDDDVSYFE